MNDIARRIDAAAERIDLKWTDERADRVELGIRRAGARRVRNRAIAKFSVAALLLIGVTAGGASFVSSRSHDSRGGSVTAAAGRGQTNGQSSAIRFADGSIAQPKTPETIVSIVESSSARAIVSLARGAAHFDVTPNRARVFRVESGPVAVEVLGTAFTVVRNERDVTVDVERGSVRVTSAASRIVLGAGEHVTVRFDEIEAAFVQKPNDIRAPQLTPSGAPTANGANDPNRAGASGSPPSGANGSASASEQTRGQLAGSQDAATGSWKTLAKAGDYDQAYDALKSAGEGAVHDEPGELLLAADVARLSKHPAEAIAPLQRVIDRYAGDARAALAAFTLGRVLLDEVGRPRDAAAAFARARALAPSGPMAADALAREVEAWWRAGDTDRARTLAEQYVASYPSGAKIRSVRKFGGLETVAP